MSQFSRAKHPSPPFIRVTGSDIGQRLILAEMVDEVLSDLQEIDAGSWLDVRSTDQIGVNELAELRGILLAFLAWGDQPHGHQPLGQHVWNLAGPFGDFGAANSVIPYRINFENLGAGSVPTPTQPATAPAQRVEVTYQLSEDLDWSTFQFTEFGFGDTVVNIPGGLKTAFESVPMTFNGTSFTVDVELDFDTTTGLVRILFQSIDSTTQLPPDVLTGFLPPEDGTGRGKGYFSYSVQAKTGLPTGTEIRNVALITFDNQTVIATDQVDPQDPSQGTDPAKEARNTIDSGAPTSNVLALPASLATTQIPPMARQRRSGRQRHCLLRRLRLRQRQPLHPIPARNPHPACSVALNWTGFGRNSLTQSKM